ncbi:MAG: NERD domain-containing protein [Ruminococcaceae bacterium]|nr:NERD domain-containing protein [Oscillospiraceae bacterium]
MGNLFKTALHRSRASGLPPLEDIERFGADGEESIYRLLSENLDTVIRNLAVPHKNLYLEKDFFVQHLGVPFVLEVKHWKGKIGCSDGVFYQDKENGTHKELKSPVGTTNQFIHCMKKFYRLECPVWGIVVFAGEDCTLDLPEEMDGIALLGASRVLPYIKKKCREESKAFEPIDTARLLRCTRLYDNDSEFCKGILADDSIECTSEDGALVRLDTTRISFITCEHQNLRLRDKLYVTFDDGSSGVFYARDLKFTLHCLDGSWKSFSASRIRYIVF